MVHDVLIHRPTEKVYLYAGQCLSELLLNWDIKLSRATVYIYFSCVGVFLTVCLHPDFWSLSLHIPCINDAT